MGDFSAKNRASSRFGNPKGDLCNARIFRYGARVCDPQRVDLQGDMMRLTEPRSTFAGVPFMIVEMQDNQFPA